MVSMESRLRICVITSPRQKAGIIPLSNLVDILSNLCSSLYLITAGEGDAVCKNHRNIHSYSITYEPKTLLLTRIINYIALQLKICCELVRLIRKVDLCIFFMGEGLLLPVLVCRLLGKYVILNLAASSVRIIETSKGSLYKPLKLLEVLNYLLSNEIILYSSNLIKEWNLEKYRSKIFIAHKHFLDFDKFKVQKQLNERGNLIGHIGRLSAEKGTLNFVEAIPRILGEKDEVKFLIGGDGRLRGEIEKYLEEENLNAKVKLLGWIPHDELPKYLDDLKMLVLPSYTEGLPNIMLEAMACGTPVLATQVGAIPDVIKDGKTGFIMKDNSPECIAENAIRVLNHPNLEQIAQNARALVEREFTFEKAVARYREILSELLSKN